MNIEWKAIYNDGSEFSQFQSGKEQKYTDIDRSKVAGFQVLKNKIPRIYISLKPEEKFFFRKRVAIYLGGGRRKEEVIYLAGAQKRLKEGKIERRIYFLYFNGTVEKIEDFQEDHPWRYPIIFLPEERV